MAIFQRLSDSFWTYVSPNKTKTTTPQTVPNVKTRGVHQSLQGSIGEIVRQSRSMSPIARVDSWRMDSSSTVTAGTKRKQPHTPSTGAGRRRKIYKMEDGDVDYVPDHDEDGDIAMDYEEMEEGSEEQQYDDEIEDQYNCQVENEVDAYDEEDAYDDSETGEEDDDDGDMGDLTANISATHLRSSKSPSISTNKGFYFDDETELDTTLVVSEAEYHRASPNRRKVINLPKEQFSRGVSTEELQAEGWSDEHITLVQKLAMRGFEPLLPEYWKMDFKWLPDALFEQDDEAFISSVKGGSNAHIRGIKALDKLFEIGGRVRDRVLIDGNVTAEQQSMKSLKEYLKWADTDADLNSRAAIPLIAIEAKPADTPVDAIQENARRKMARLYARYREAFRAQPSIEHSSSPSYKSTSTAIAHPIPQIYGIIASHTLVALIAYRPDTPDNEVRTITHFDMKDKECDVWNAVVLAIVVCHLRNVQVLVAEETGLGMKVPGQNREVEEDDPDL